VEVEQVPSDKLFFEFSEEISKRISGAHATVTIERVTVPLLDQFP